VSLLLGLGFTFFSGAVEAWLVDALAATGFKGDMESVFGRIGFTPEKGGRPLAEMRKIASASIEHGWRVPAVKWLMVEALFIGGVGIYAFYALQPYLLELYGDPQAYQIAGLVAAIVAGAQILGGVAAPQIRRLFHRRTSALIAMAGASVLTLGAIGIVESRSARRTSTT
jgi:hypothetical protein